MILKIFGIEKANGSKQNNQRRGKSWYICLRNKDFMKLQILFKMLLELYNISPCFKLDYFVFKVW